MAENPNLDDVCELASAAARSELELQPENRAWREWTEEQLQALARRIRSSDTFLQLISDQPTAATHAVAHTLGLAWAHALKSAVRAARDSGEITKLPGNPRMWEVSERELREQFENLVEAGNVLSRLGASSMGDDFDDAIAFANAAAMWRGEVDATLRKETRGPRKQPATLIAEACDAALTDRSKPQRAEIARGLCKEILGKDLLSYLLHRRVTKAAARERRRQ